jgi:hypothetical protein
VFVYTAEPFEEAGLDSKAACWEMDLFLGYVWMAFRERSRCSHIAYVFTFDMHYLTPQVFLGVKFICIAILTLYLYCPSQRMAKT